MKHEAIIKLICRLQDGDIIKLRKGGKHALISTRTESQLFNVLHRHYNAARMSIRISANDPTLLEIRASEWDGKEILFGFIRTF